MCNGFFVWAGLLALRLPDLTAEVREYPCVARRLGRTRGDEAWIATTDGTAEGTLVVRTARPDRPR